MLHHEDSVLGKHDMLLPAPDSWCVDIELQALASFVWKPIDTEEQQSAAMSVPAWTHPLSRKDSCVHGM